ncbi:hypothetical protein MSG28_012983 [Choristoneura fumiferana]|uniref:Uncharacterized protein n=1 Tax=Choristoneura fumiferana TaxID=7141 RepID=A0ACC0KS38_CHOFU|nr:hypothetical protein MSG28_012983 [Choristoneura fumiferana]
MDLSNCVCEGVLVGIGNPLLDISASVDSELLSKYDLQPDDAIMAEDKHMPLYKELMVKYSAEFIAGGSVQNSLRVAQWILKTPKVTDEAATGTCAVLVTGTHRSLCANLAAAQKFTPEHLAKPECKEGFFVAVSPESILQLAARAHAGGHAFIMNLSAPFVSQFYKEPLEKMLPYVDEAEAFAKAFGIEETDLQAIAVKISALPKLNEKRQRVVVITQGCEPVILVEGGKITLIPVAVLSREEIVDTNGAGDAFAGGFLSQMVTGAPYTTCVKCGIYAATHVIKHSGCTFSGNSDFKRD